MTVAAVFHLASQTPTVLGRTSGDADISLTSFKQSQAALVKRRLTLNAALNRPAVRQLSLLRGIGTDELSWLDQKLKVDAKADSEFMRITIEGDSEDDLLVLMDAVTKSYLADVEERHNGDRKRRRTQLEANQRTYKAELEKYHTRIDSIANLLGSKDGATLVAIDSVLQNELREASRERSLVRDELRFAEAELESHDSSIGYRTPVAREALGAIAGTGVASVFVVQPFASIDIAVTASAISDAIRNDPRMLALESEVETARKKLFETEDRFEKGATSPALTAARETFKAVEAKRDRYRIESRQAIESKLKETQRHALEGRRQTLQDAVTRLRRKEQIAQSKIASVEDRINRTNRYRVDLEDFKRQIEHIEKLNTTLTDEIEHLKLELGAPTRVMLAEEPYVIPGIEGRRRAKYTLMGAIGVLVVGLGGIVGWEVMGRRVTHSDDVVTAIGLRVLGTLPPSYPGASEPQAVAHGRAVVEAVDSARTMLLHGSRESGAPLKTILIASAVAREGKTTLSGHLAISLARAGYRTLLVDGDLQAPSAHRLYNLKASPGLCELLCGECGSADSVQPSPIPGLSILTSGGWSLAARQGLVGDGWRRIRGELEARFDFIVVDTAPLLLVSDTLLFARESDCVVLSILVDVSQVVHMTETVEKLRAIGANVSGAIVNGVWHKAYLPGYGQRRNDPADETTQVAASNDRSINQ
jgi:capsular exopolysaccharide synthesis family protein